MDSRGPDPPAQLTSPDTVPDSRVTAAGSQQGPVVPHIQNYGGQAHRNFPPASLIQQQGQITAKHQWQIWQEQQYLTDGQNQQPNFNPNFSRPAVTYSQDYGCQPQWDIPTANFIQGEEQTTALPTLQQQWHQQDYSINRQNGPFAPNQNEVYMPFQQQGLNQQMTNTSRPALTVNKNYGVQGLFGPHSRNTIQRLEQTTPQPTSHQQQQQHQQWLQYQQQFTNEQIASHKNDAYMSNQQPYTQQRTSSSPAIFHAQNNGAQAASGPYPFIQQKRHTTPQPALQQQQPHQQHQHQNFMKGQNERLTPHQIDASMHFQRPNFDQFMTSPSNGAMGNMSTSAAIPMGNLTTSSAVPMENLSAFPLNPIGNMSATPAVPMGNLSVGPALAEGNVSTFPLHPMGNMTASPPVTMENKSTSLDIPMGNMFTSPTSLTKNMSVYPVELIGNMSTSPSGPIGNQSASPTYSIGNDHSTLHEFNQSPHLDPTDDSSSQFPIMAEKRNYDDSSGENVNCVLAKHPKTDEDTDPLCTSVNNQDLSGDESGNLDSGNKKDPLSDLTKDQCVVLYTLFLCMDNSNTIRIDDDVSMGDIDFRKIVKELENKGLVMSYSDNKKYIPYDERCMIMKSFREDCLLSDIDKDFFLQVASDKCIETYVYVYFYHGDGSRESEDIGPITAIGMIVEGHGHRLPYSLRAKLPDFLLKDEEVLGMFGTFWCKARNTNPLSDQIPDEKLKNFYSASTILSGLKNELMEMQLSEKKWSILISILMSENYSVCVSIPWEEKRKIIQQTFKGIQDGKEENTEENFVLLKELDHCDKLLSVDKEYNKVYFVSEEIRHQVMGYFVLNCLESERDYENYLNLSSVDSIFEYARPWTYKRSQKERCVYLPEGTEESFIERLGIDAIKFAADHYKFKYEISSKLNIPKEVLKWDYDARCRYIECAKKGTQTMHRARAMIVGCAGAGKTTLLRRLQQRSIQELRQIQSTVGLEVYENLFEIDRDRKCLKGLEEDVDTENKCLLSVVDFAGQCAYYACHQVYLSRRAFYLLVIDMSKRFDEIVDQTLCEQEETMFADWTFGQYVIFWLKSIHTYCEDNTPVVTLATHSDEVQNMVNGSIYDDLLELLKNEPDLKKHLDRERCFHIGFPKDDGEPLDNLTNVVECIASIALEDRWREKIPRNWAYCEVVLRQNKQNGKKIILVKEFRKQVSIKKNGKENEISDVLKFYHDIGAILHYNEDHLKDSAIMDVQWFVDCFKYIITDPKHARDLVENDKDWKIFFNSGYLSRKLLNGIWKKKDMVPRKCNSTLKYMQRLGLLAKGPKAHYVPCMNKLDFDMKLKDYITKLEQKTSVLVFNFQFLPHFFYFRLVVACIVSTEWTIIEDNGQKCLFKNIALFKFEEHTIGVAVTTSTIQVQIYKQGNGKLNGKIVMNIKQTIEDVLENLTKNFHKKTLYDIGYQCSQQNILEENATSFILEKDLIGRGEFSCPNHGLKNHHVINENDLLRFWKYEKHEETTDAYNTQQIQEQRKKDITDKVKTEGFFFSEILKNKLIMITDKEVMNHIFQLTASKFRKPKDNSLLSTELNNFFAQCWQHSVGHLLCYGLTGTAFRVGDRYLLTAFHIIESSLDACLKMIIENAQCDPNRSNNYLTFLQVLNVTATGSGVEMMIENGIKECITTCRDNICISGLLEVLRVTGFSVARENILKNINENHMQVVFGRMKEHEEGIKYDVKFDIPFYSKTEDIAILEVVPTNLHRLPTAFALERSIIPPDSIHIVGYPASHGRKQIFDPKCPLISEMEARSTLTKWMAMYPGENFENFSKACNSAFSGNEKVLFHCSESTAHGASGSPGLILSDTDKPKVYLMLQEGFPSFVYGNNCQIDIKNVPKEYLIESGISMSRVYSLLSSTQYLINLRNAIFHF